MKKQNGFTLIELLVVIAILGILVAVVMPRIISFISSGTVAAANVEAHDVQLAVTAYMADEGVYDFDGDVSPISTTGAETFLSNAGNLQAIYTITDGEITGAMPIEGGKYAGLTYTVEKGWFKT